MGALDGRSVVVTGASSGIGEAIARRFVSEGALVVIGSRSEPDVAGTTWEPTDVAHPSEADAMIAAAVEDHGRLDVLVNNAGVQVVATVADTTDEAFHQVMEVNARGVFNCCRAALRWIATALAEVVFEEYDDPAAARAAAVERHPVGRLGTPEDVANLAVWLASDESTFVSGSLFRIDGGLTAQSPIGG